MKILFLVRGLGEYAQAEAFAKFAISKGDECLFLLARVEDLELYIKAVKKNGFKYQVTKNPDETEKLIYEYNPVVMFLCNSKTSRDFIKRRPKIKKLLVGSLDSNWTYNNCGSMYKVFSWVDNFFAVMPKRIFDIGRAEHGGHFKISQKILDKIYCPGFIPSGRDFSQKEKDTVRKNLNMKKGEKLIYLYLGRGVTFRWKWYLVPSLTCVFDELYKEYKNFKVLFVGEHKIERTWAFSQNWVDRTDYLENIIASSDLVIQHHGLGTLPRVIRSRVPVICLTPKIFPKMPHYIASYYFEIEPFAKLGVCINMQIVNPLDVYLSNIKDLLLNNKMRNNMIVKQKDIFCPGEENLYNFIIDKLERL